MIHTAELIGMGRLGRGTDRVGRLPVRQEILEDALMTCLAALSELAAAAGQVDRATRLAEAAGVLRAGASRLRLVEPPARWKRCPLTAREQEVAKLIALGLTNRQIADELVISERTADTHVQNILGKLGLKSRAQVAAWFVSSGT
jgi:DNA-binding NarL/FixJ family response regulator